MLFTIFCMVKCLWKFLSVFCNTNYDIKIDISRFDGQLGGDIELSVRWSVFDGEGKVVYGVKATDIFEPTAGGDYDHLVAAQSRALAVFSRELADVIKELTEG